MGGELWTIVEPFFLAAQEVLSQSQVPDQQQLPAHGNSEPFTLEQRIGGEQEQGTKKMGSRMELIGSRVRSQALETKMEISSLLVPSKTSHSQGH